jgi:Xaa-Pro aminopeptidase
MYQHINECQSELRSHNIDAVVLKLPENVVLFSQYWPRNAVSYIFIPAYGEPSVICPEPERQDTVDCGLDNVFVYEDVRLEDGDPYDQLVDIFSKIAKNQGLGKDAVIGIEQGYDSIAPTFCSGKVALPGDQTLAAISKGFSTQNLVNVKSIVAKIRLIKNDSDIAKLHTVNKITHMALDYFEKIIETPGICEVDVLAYVESYVTKLACGFNGAKAARSWGQLSVGVKTADAYCNGVISDKRRLMNGDLAMYEIGVVVDGYWADMTRTGCVGGFSGQKAELRDVVEQALEASIAAVRDGACGNDVDAAARDVIEHAGYGKYFVHGVGHGLGFTYNEGYPKLVPNSKDELRTNMVIAIEPAIYLPGVGGYRTEVNVLVRQSDGVVLGKQ